MLPQTIKDFRRQPYTTSDYRILALTTANYRGLAQTATFHCQILLTTEEYRKLTQTTATKDYCTLPHTKAHYRRRAQTTVERVHASFTLPQPITDSRNSTADYCRIPQTTHTTENYRRLPQPTAPYRTLRRLPLPETATENRILAHTNAVYSFWLFWRGLSGWRTLLKVTIWRSSGCHRWFDVYTPHLLTDYWLV